MSNNFKSSCTLLLKVVTTYTTLITLQLCKVAKVVLSSIGRFADDYCLIKTLGINGIDVLDLDVELVPIWW